MNRWLDYIHVWYGCSLGISDDLINGYFFVLFFPESLAFWLWEDHEHAIKVILAAVSVLVFN